MKKLYILFSLVFIVGLFAFGQGAAESWNLYHHLSGPKQYIASDYIKCYPPGEHYQDGFSYTAQQGESFVAEIDPFLVLPPDEGEIHGDPDPNGDGNYFVGETSGSFNVSPTGAATYTIPIKLPQGINGMMPNLAITYNSQAGNGNMGYGWNISGLSAITRIGNDLYHDTNIDPVDFTASDKFALDGNRLVLGSGTYGSDGSKYTTEMYSGSRITAIGTQVYGPQSFKVETKDGKIVYYGNSTDSQFRINSSVMSWLITKIEDIHGNEINFVYNNAENEINISEIHYGGNSKGNLDNIYKISFTYDNDLRTDPQKTFLLGNKIETNSLLDFVSVKSNDTEIHKYDFKYNVEDDENVSYSHLVSVQEFGKDGASIAPVKFEWGTNSHSTLKVQIDENQSMDREFYFGDINGDGLTDMIELQFDIRNNDIGGVYRHYTNWGYRLSQGNSYGDLQSFNTSIDRYLIRLMLGDFNGDGKIDIALIKSNTKDHNDVTKLYKILLSFRTDVYTVRSANQIYGQLDKGYFVSGDFDGDGESEIIKFQRNNHDGGQNVWAFNITRFGTLKAYFWGDFWFGNEPEKAQIIVGNFANGKEQNLLITRKMTGVEKTKIVSLLPVASGKSEFKTHWTSMSLDANDIMHTGDFNGDGYTDILKLHITDDNNAAGGWHIYLTTGKGFSTDGFNIFVLPNVNMRLEEFAHGNLITTGDYNGDGLTDIMHMFKNGPLRTGFKLFESTGVKFKHHMGELDIKGFLNSGFDEDDNSAYAYINQSRKIMAPYLDYNGDGKTDIFTHQLWGEGDIVVFKETALYSFYNNDKKHFLSSIVKNEKKITFNISKSVQDNYIAEYNSYYTTNENVVNINAPISKCTESHIYLTENTYLTTKYFYKGARYNRYAGKFLGYSNLQVKDIDNKITTTTDYELKYNYYLSVLSESKTDYITDNYPLYLTSTKNIWSINEIAVLDIGYSIFQYIEKQNTKNYDIVKNNNNLDNVFLKSTRTLNTYDENANLEVSLKMVDKDELDIDATDGSFNFQTKTESIYYPSIGNSDYWIPHRLQKVTTTFQPNWGGVDEQIKEFTYIDDANNWMNVETVTTNSNTELAIKKQFEYHPNSNGRVTKETISTPSYTFNEENTRQTLEDRISSYFYGDNNDERYLTKTVNAKGHAAIIELYDEILGKPLKIKDANELITEYKYDKFGSQIEVVHPDGIIEKNGLRWANSSDKSNFQTASFFNWSNSSGSTPILVYYDKYNRELGSKSYDFNGDEVYTKKEFDEKGRVEYEYAPKIGEDENITRYHYDHLNRIEKVEHHLKTVNDVSNYYSRTEYNGLSQTNYYGSPNGEERTITEKFASGNTKTIEDEEGNIILYSYFPTGLTRNITVFGNITRFEYDINGNRTLMDDPSLGVTNYENNPYGELMERTDAEGQKSKYRYDVLGRLIKSSDSEGNTIETLYDTKKEGLVSEIALMVGAGSTDYLSHSIEYEYDDLLRVQSKTELVNEQDYYTYSYEYDHLGRTKYMTYPTGLKIRNKYNAKGYLKEICDANTKKSIWSIEADGYDKLGRLHSYTVNDKTIKTTNTYDDITGYLTEIETTKDASQIQHLKYDYDVLGNMTYRQDLTKNIKEEFFYDDLSRLTVQGKRTLFFQNIV